jgi:predicted nuclease of predicted toxin-antitoxin system
VHALLLDENLSAAAAVALRNEGLDIVHVRERGLLGATDWQVLEAAFDEDRVLVTANVGDFRKLASARELHAGIVLVESGGLLREEQIELVRRIHAALAAEPDLVNRVLTVALDGTMSIEELPP